jgi:UrcA family protein
MMKSIVIRHALIGIVTLTAMWAVNGAVATTQTSEPQRAVVRYTDLDPSRPEDARRLYRRIKRAARAVCDNYPSSDLVRLREYEKCLDHAVTEAMAKVQSEQVRALSHLH